MPNDLSCNALPFHSHAVSCRLTPWSCCGFVESIESSAWWRFRWSRCRRSRRSWERECHPSCSIARYALSTVDLCHLLSPTYDHSFYLYGWICPSRLSLFIMSSIIPLPSHPPSLSITTENSFSLFLNQTTLQNGKSPRIPSPSRKSQRPNTQSRSPRKTKAATRSGQEEDAV